MAEEWKWRGGVRRHPLYRLGETYKDYVKLTFFKGAALEDPAGLFNASLDGNTRRAIDIRETSIFDEKAFKSFIGGAVTLNTSSTGRRRAKA